MHFELHHRVKGIISKCYACRYVGPLILLSVLHSALLLSRWSPRDPGMFVVASQVGRLEVVDVLRKKQQSVPLTTRWVMACDINLTGTLVASGGLDNAVALHTIPGTPNQRDADTSRRHDAYVGKHNACLALLSGSLALAYLESASMHFHPNDPRFLASGSGDGVAKVGRTTAPRVASYSFRCGTWRPRTEHKPFRPLAPATRACAGPRSTRFSPAGQTQHPDCSMLARARLRWLSQGFTTPM